MIAARMGDLQQLTRSRGWQQVHNGTGGGLFWISSKLAGPGLDCEANFAFLRARF
jgi:hypothetical protein